MNMNMNMSLASSTSIVTITTMATGTATRHPTPILIPIIPILTRPPAPSLPPPKRPSRAALSKCAAPSWTKTTAWPNAIAVFSVRAGCWF